MPLWNGEAVWASLHVNSSKVVGVVALMSPTMVPPQPVTHGSDAGYRTWQWVSPMVSAAPQSPAAMKTVTPRGAAAWRRGRKTPTTLPLAAAVPIDAGWSSKYLAQLIDSTEGGLSPGGGKTARLKKDSQPSSLVSVKYTLMLAPWATAATISMSRAVSML